MTTTVTIQTGDHVALVTHADGAGVRTDRVEAHTTITTHIWQGKGLTICEEQPDAVTRGVATNAGPFPDDVVRTTVLPETIGKSLEEADAYSEANMPIGAQRVSLHVLREQITGIQIIRPSEAQTLTIAVLTTQNGFHLVGKSACADPKAYNAEKGERFAVDDALRHLWPLHAYLLRQRLHDETPVEQAA